MGSEKKPRRLFVAIDLPEPLKEILQICQKQIMGLHLAQGKYPRLEHLHLTLKFLGHVEEVHIPLIVEKLKQIPIQPLELSLGHIGHFPVSGRSTHVIWAEIVAKGLDSLAASIEESLRDITGAADHAFHPHVTLMRVTRCPDSEKFLNALKKLSLAPQTFHVLNFALFDSELSKSGPVYRVIERFSA